MHAFISMTLIYHYWELASKQKHCMNMRCGWPTKHQIYLLAVIHHNFVDKLLLAGWNMFKHTVNFHSLFVISKWTTSCNDKRECKLTDLQNLPVFLDQLECINRCSNWFLEEQLQVSTPIPWAYKENYKKLTQHIQFGDMINVSAH